jgi:hypothetical protein
MAKIEFSVKYKLNPDYDGDYQYDKLTDANNPDEEVVGLYGKFRNLPLAMQMKQKCKDWFNKEMHAVERVNREGKVHSEVRTTLHDNVVVWLERYVDGHLDLEWQECDVKSEKKLAKV